MGNLKKKKPVWREWLDAAVFAIIAATLIRTFFFEAYTIPTGSMEGSLLINDYLFVTKMAYGPRVPMTPVAVPLVHNTLPLIGGKSYVESIQLKYHRLPGFGNVNRYDIVVFNYPGGDSVVEERPGDDYYTILRSEFNNNREDLNSKYKVITRPVDKEENYIKRCMGTPGDKLEVRDAVVYVNDKPANTYPHQKLSYEVQTRGFGLTEDFLDENNLELMQLISSNDYLLNVPNDGVEALRKLPQVVSVRPYIQPRGVTENGATFPHDTANFKWSRDNFGPIVIPSRGTTVSITPKNVALYRRVIVNYEGNKMEERDGRIFINGQPATSYTFKMDYFWMMGDNRHNSLDSRYWGFVPQDHVVGKAWFVWLSYGKGGIRWSRLLHGIHSLEK